MRGQILMGWYRSFVLRHRESVKHFGWWVSWLSMIFSENRFPLFRIMR
jgi:hypothetical protein